MIFELAGHGFAHDLAQRLRPAWLVWTEPRENGWAVSVELRPVADDLPHLFREVGTWAGESNLRGVAFELDGRVYTLLRRNPLGMTA